MAEIRQDSFDAFVRAHTTALLRTAVLLTGSRDVAEELVQDTLAHLYPRWDRVVAADVPIAYVRRSLANRFVSSRRAPASRNISMWELPDGWDGTDISDAVATRREIWQLLGDLPSRQRAAIVLRYFHDLTDEQIADTMGCRAVTVRSLVSRGVIRMRGGIAPGHDRGVAR
ncbi:MAG: SigE family RNA polymerase sigma factor [Jatrophihabitantaceae bacterium]